MNKRVLPPQAQTGFTLIELMITVVIVGILAAVAYPAYQDQVRRSRRAGAQSAMLQIAQKEMQLLLDARRYVAAANATAIAAAPIGVGIDAKVASMYNFSVTVNNAAGTVPTFTVTAVPQGAQASDSCGTLTINHLGAKTPSAGCW